MTHPTRRPVHRGGRAARRAATVAATALTGAVLLGCGGDDASSGAASTPTFEVATTLSGPAAVTTPPQGTCISRVPGQPISEAEAEVRFSTSGVCPSYVTVVAGTKVRWTNDHGEPVTVTLSEAVALAPPSSGTEVFPQLDDGPTVFEEEVAPGATYAHPMAAAGTYYFRLDVLPTFLGTVEVR
ncbi:MAG: hypothetical protein AB7W59_17455 [Acidimicrobiia bacterium]